MLPSQMKSTRVGRRSSRSRAITWFRRNGWATRSLAITALLAALRNQRPATILQDMSVVAGAVMRLTNGKLCAASAHR